MPSPAGADVNGELPHDLHWEALADPHAMTAVYMGKKTFPALAAKLIAQGLSPETPALLAESVGQADQRAVESVEVGGERDDRAHVEHTRDRQ